MRIGKSVTAKQLFKQFPGLRKDLRGGEFRSNGYFLSTLSEKGNGKQVENYVKNQGNTREIKQLRLLSLIHREHTTWALFRGR